MNKKDALNFIARTTLKLRTLERRNGCDLDFHDLHCCQIARALDEAYEEGKKAGRAKSCNAESGCNNEHRWATVITPQRAFGLAADLLLGLMQQSPNNHPTANDIAKLFEKFKRLSREED